MIDALKRASAKRITVVAAVLPVRPPGQEAPRPRADLGPAGRRPVQDRRRRPASSRSTCTPRRSRASSTARSTTCSRCRCSPTTSRDKYAGRPITVVSPDSGRVRVAEQWTDRLGGCPLAFIHKTRDPTDAQRGRGQPGRRRRRGPDLHPRRRHDRHRRHDREGRRRAPQDAGAADVVVAATHAVLSGPAVDRLKNSRISEVVVTNTLPIPPEKQFDKLTVLSIAPLLARAIREVFEDGSVTSLFDGLS